MKLDEFLSENDVEFERLPHQPAYTANRIAKVLHIPGKEVAKTVVLRADDQFVLVVLPATHQVDLTRVQVELGVGHVALASEEEITRLFPDCEQGAIPPFGSLYHLTTLVDESLAEDEQIVFEAQNHQEAFRIAYSDFENQEHPRIGHFAASTLVELVSRYSKRLIRQVKQQLPNHLRRRVDPEDIVQSVFRSFFERLKHNPLPLQDTQRIWRLLTLLTYHEVRSVIRFHEQERRDVRRDQRDGSLSQQRSDPEPRPDETLHFDDVFQHLLDHLPKKERQVVSLRLLGNNIAAIARKQRCSERTVQRILTKVQDLLRHELDWSE